MRSKSNLVTALIIAIVVLLLASIVAVLAVQNDAGDVIEEVPAEPGSEEVPTHVDYTYVVEGQNVHVRAALAEEVSLAQPAEAVVDAPQEQPPQEQQPQEQQPQEQPPQEQPPQEQQPQEQPPQEQQPQEQPPQEQQPVQPPSTGGGVPEIIFVDYQVQAGDTLYGIARSRNSSIELMAQHGIDIDDMIVGNVIPLPVANPDFCPGRRPYVVRDKDTLFRIARQFGTDHETLRAINGLEADYSIDVSQVICVP